MISMDYWDCLCGNGNIEKWCISLSVLLKWWSIPLNSSELLALTPDVEWNSLNRALPLNKLHSSDQAQY